MTTITSDAGHDDLLMPFLREVVRYRGHFVSRYAALVFEAELHDNFEATLEVAELPAQDMDPNTVPALADGEAFAHLRFPASEAPTRTIDDELALDLLREEVTGAVVFS